MKQRTTRSPAEKVAFCAVSAAAALILSYIEHLIPFLTSFPGIKPGLANVCVTLVFYYVGLPEAFAVSFLRISLSSLLFGNPVSFAFSCAGAALAFGFLILSKFVLKDKISFLGVSIGCAALHNVGQVAVCAAMFADASIFGMLSVLLPVSLLTGGITGSVLHILKKYAEKIL